MSTTVSKILKSYLVVFIKKIYLSRLFSWESYEAGAVGVP